jgi:hypothetical protein
VWGTFYDEFINSNIYTSCYYFLFFIRRLLLSLSFHFLYHYPVLQIIIVILSSWIVTAYLLIYKPYKSRFNNYFQILNECNISLGYTFSVLLYFKDKVNSHTISWIVLSFIYLSYIMHLLNSISAFIKMILKCIKPRTQSKYIQRKDSTIHNSNNIT